MVLYRPGWDGDLVSVEPVDVGGGLSFDVVQIRPGAAGVIDSVLKRRMADSITAVAERTIASIINAGLTFRGLSAHGAPVSLDHPWDMLRRRSLRGSNGTGDSS